MLRIVYNAVLPFFLVFSFPGFWKKMRARGGKPKELLQRLGWYTEELQEALKEKSGPIWIHAVSVGEAAIASKLIDEIRKIEPSQALVATSSTPTGLGILRSRVPQAVPSFYNPVDLPFVLDRAFKLIQPRVIVLVESEIWPNLILKAKERGIGLIIANARLSRRSEKRYRKLKSLTQPLFSRFDKVLLPESEDGPRWRGLGLAKEKVVVTGSVKYDPGQYSPSNQGSQFGKLLERAWPDASKKAILLVGSSHQGEELFFARAYRELCKDHHNLILAITPRHVERASAIVEELAKENWSVLRRSKIEQSDLPPPSKNTIFLIDSTGELGAWYQVATCVAIGKSFLSKGGQNPVEAILAGKPVIVGPHMENFPVLTKDLLAEKGVLQTQANLGDFQAKVSKLLGNKDAQQELAKRARQVLGQHEGATKRTVEEILQLASQRSS